MGENLNVPSDSPSPLAAEYWQEAALAGPPHSCVQVQVRTDLSSLVITEAVRMSFYF